MVWRHALIIWPMVLSCIGQWSGVNLKLDNKGVWHISEPSTETAEGQKKKQKSNIWRATEEPNGARLVVGVHEAELRACCDDKAGLLACLLANFFASMHCNACLQTADPSVVSK
ncbi:hypothetical protein BCV70DRAFT_203116 [Testicularia cyperi]|uniref:Uncharacterized protein n=1 Tax=Testicularia cyperi TaxID=1882483 RepID=A0A317XG94_9BASI|nr:hypothetical protein BCV70DRAFT_203116 [Testicularia cyperi]